MIDPTTGSSMLTNAGRDAMHHPKEMDDFEFQAYYDTGIIPERFWDEEIRRFKRMYLNDEIDIVEFECRLHVLMGIP